MVTDSSSSGCTGRISRGAQPAQDFVLLLRRKPGRDYDAVAEQRHEAVFAEFVGQPERLRRRESRSSCEVSIRSLSRIARARLRPVAASATADAGAGAQQQARPLSRLAAAGLVDLRGVRSWSTWSPSVAPYMICAAMARFRAVPLDARPACCGSTMMHTIMNAPMTAGGDRPAQGESAARSTGLSRKSPSAAPSGRVRMKAAQNKKTREMFVVKSMAATSAAKALAASTSAPPS